MGCDAKVCFVGSVGDVCWGGCDTEETDDYEDAVIWDWRHAAAFIFSNLFYL